MNAEEKLPKNIIVKLLPDSAETRQFFDATRFAMIKPGAIFYNIGRGMTVAQDALLGALRSGKIGAAWLDVSDPETLPDEHPLSKEPNCFISPHIAGGHTGEAKALVRHFLKNFDRFVPRRTIAGSGHVASKQKTT
jgi:phosphoglycerate dehydrogenase-like enzyme